MTLHCSDRTASSFSSSFYKDGVLMGSSSTGNLTLLSVSTSGAGESPSSRLEVTGEPSSCCLSRGCCYI